jgi:organic radical activating enzyme
MDVKELSIAMGGDDAGVNQDLIEVMRGRTHMDIKEYNTDTFREIRETMMRNEWHPGCYKCKADEESKGHSMRTEANEFFDSFTDEVKLEYLEITVGRKCNLKCMSCGPEYSDKWDEDALKFPELGVPADDIERLKKVEQLDLDTCPPELFRDVKYIKVTGGEPFLHRQFLNFVVRLADSGLAENINLEIFTNCTWWPAKTDYDALTKFQKITICTSIDGIGAVNDVLRFPSKWERVEQTLDKWIEMREQWGWDKVEIKTATTVNVINAPYMYEFMLWARLIKRINVTLQTVYEPHYLSIIHWPNWYKEKLAYTINQQFNEDFHLDKTKKIRGLLLNLCTPMDQPDRSYEYTDTIKKLLRHRGILDLNQISKFKNLVELSAVAIPEWGPGSRPEFQGRSNNAQ